MSETGLSSTLLQQVTLKSIDRHEPNCQSIVADPKIQFCAADDDKGLILFVVFRIHFDFVFRYMSR